MDLPLEEEDIIQTDRGKNWLGGRKMDTSAHKMMANLLTGESKLCKVQGSGEYKFLPLYWAYMLQL